MRMLNTIVALAGVVLVLGLAGCGSSDTAETAPSTSAATSTTSTSSQPSTTASSSSTTSTSSEETTSESVESAPEPAPVTADPIPEQSAPQGIWSEPGVGYQCAATDAWVYDPADCTAANLGGEPSYDQHWGPGAAIPAEEIHNSLDNSAPAKNYGDPATVPSADGGTCPAYLCGYGHDEYGNPRPSNTEIQSWRGDCIAVNTVDYCRATDPYTN